MTIQICVNCGRRCGPAVTRCPDCGSSWLARPAPATVTEPTLPPVPTPAAQTGLSRTSLIVLTGVMGFVLGGILVAATYHLRSDPSPSLPAVPPPPQVVNPTADPPYTGPPIPLPTPGGGPPTASRTPAPPYPVTIRTRPNPPGSVPGNLGVGLSAPPIVPAFPAGPPSPAPAPPIASRIQVRSEPAPDLPQPDGEHGLLTVRNSTPMVVELTLTGPSEQNVTVAPNSTVPFRLIPGSYRVRVAQGVAPEEEAALTVTANRSSVCTVTRKSASGPLVLSLQIEVAPE